jgi:hypothetical protein
MSPDSRPRILKTTDVGPDIITYHQPMPRKIPQKRIAHLQCGGSLKSGTTYIHDRGYASARSVTNDSACTNRSNHGSLVHFISHRSLSLHGFLRKRLPCFDPIPQLDYLSSTIHIPILFTISMINEHNLP